MCSLAATTAPVLVGTTTGQLFELLVEEKDKREKYVNKLFELTERLEPFVGVQVKLSYRNSCSSAATTNFGVVSSFTLVLREL